MKQSTARVPSVDRRKEPGTGLWTALARRPLSAVALLVLATVFLAALCAPLITQYGPNDVNLDAVLSGPSPEHWLGTDQLGRDMFSRLVHGSRLSPLAAAAAVAIATAIGVPLGVAAGYFGGWADAVTSRLAEALMAVPGLIFVLTIVAVLGPGLANLVVAIGLILVPSFFRVTRGAVLDVRHEMFIEASAAIGCSRARIALVHVLPNASAPILIQATLAFAIAVIAEAGLSFLGLGARPPAASWGRLLAESSERPDHAHLLFVPAGALLITVICASLLTDALRDAQTMGARK